MNFGNLCLVVVYLLIECQNCLNTTKSVRVHYNLCIIEKDFVLDEVQIIVLEVVLKEFLLNRSTYIFDISSLKYHLRRFVIPEQNFRLGLFRCENHSSYSRTPPRTLRTPRRTRLSFGLIYLQNLCVLNFGPLSHLENYLRFWQNFKYSEHIPYGEYKN